jgi:hypothetical protein
MVDPSFNKFLDPPLPRDLSFINPLPMGFGRVTIHVERRIHVLEI